MGNCDSENSGLEFHSVCLSLTKTKPIHQHGKLISALCPMQMNNVPNHRCLANTPGEVGKMSDHPSSV